MDTLIISFFKGLFNESGRVSSKRVVGFLTFCQMCIMANGEQFFQHAINMAVFGILFSLVCYCFSLNTFLQSKAMTVKKDVAGNIIDTNAPGANQIGKEVLENPNP